VEAIVLAGGFGTRLQSVVSSVPKPMAPINNIPFLEYIFKYLHEYGITKIVLSVCYKWEVIKDYFGNKFENIELVYVVEDEPLGTGGAIKKSLNEIKNKNVFIVNGDTFFNIDLNCLTLIDDENIEIALKSMTNFDRYGCVETNNKNIISKFTEKSYIKKGDINGGIYLINKSIFINYTLPLKFSFEEFMQNNLEELQIKTKVFDNYFIDIGIPEDYEKAQFEIRRYL
jgi:D-glycero-alpha-D-manno-heptose 1-phosphate guanylyltransferase